MKRQRLQPGFVSQRAGTGEEHHSPSFRIPHVAARYPRRTKKTVIPSGTPRGISKPERRTSASEIPREYTRDDGVEGLARHRTFRAAVLGEGSRDRLDIRCPRSLATTLGMTSCFVMMTLLLLTFLAPTTVAQTQ